jgi:hypothetical protein
MVIFESSAVMAEMVFAGTEPTFANGWIQNFASIREEF